jgi:hypothetical protein
MSARCFVWRQNNPEVNYSLTRISGVGEVSLEEISRCRGEVAGACECGEEPSGSIKRGEFLD